MRYKRDSLGDRMKDYENTSRVYLARRMPAIIRLDGKAFHTFTKGFKKPFDNILIETMWKTAIFLCENIQGCQIAYTQSDEISLLLTDYENLNTSAWFDKNIQKMVSISASMATLAFNKSFQEIYNENIKDGDISKGNVYERRLMTAMFDSRVFILPKEEVVNYFVWRQQDASKNSIQMVGRTEFSHKELHKKNGKEIQEMLFQKKDINWSDLPTYEKRGACIIKESYLTSNSVRRSRWIEDKDIPIFTEDRDYIERYI